MRPQPQFRRSLGESTIRGLRRAIPDHPSIQAVQATLKKCLGKTH